MAWDQASLASLGCLNGPDELVVSLYTNALRGDLVLVCIHPLQDAYSLHVCAVRVRRAGSLKIFPVWQKGTA